MERQCKTHGLTEFKKRSDGGYRCLKCRKEATTRSRKKLREKLVSLFGNECSICGYDRLSSALDFHHLNEEQKNFELNIASIKSFEKSYEEAQKCILVCANCHREIHAGLISLE